MNDFINNVRYYWDEYGIQTVLIVLLISVFVLFQWMDYEDDLSSTERILLTTVSMLLTPGAY